ncbi:MAG: alpha-amylase/4-alpha-glucanotransferase domain-containing protein [Candidatus Hodarchaeota archaeon]
MSQKGQIHTPLVFHFHQPPNNFDHVNQWAYERSYNPLLAAIERHSHLRVTLHITGSLLDWLTDKHPNYLDRLAGLVRKGQIELLGGAYFEAILAILPDEDKINQITLLSDKLYDHFGVKPRGMWLAERVWEPHLAKSIVDAGLDYIFIDDSHVRLCGFSELESLKTFSTEEQGAQLTIFPINESIRYLIPWKDAKETFDFLESVRSPIETRIVTIFSDAEKMGIWPATGGRTTYDVCYQDGYNGTPWIDEWFKFFNSLEWVNSILPSACMQQLPSSQLIYLPTASYDKMGQWALPTSLRRQTETLFRDIKNRSVFSINESGEQWKINDILKLLIHGSSWRGFLSKYPESNNLHKRMLYARRKIKEAEKIEKIPHLWKKLYAAQCNDVYWHGLFAGIYAVHMRHNAYQYLLSAEYEAEKILRREGNLNPISILIQDIEKDGQPEIVLETEELAAFIKPHDGGTIFELDSKSLAYNIGHAFTRKEESYHDDKTPAIADRWRKTAFRDHIVTPSIKPEEFINDEYSELSQLPQKSYQWDVKENGVILYTQNEIQRPFVQIKKEYSVMKSRPNQLEVSYEIIPKEEPQVPQAVLIEFPFILAGDPKLFIAKVNNQKIDFFKAQRFKAQHISQIDKTFALCLDIKFDSQVDCLWGPIYSYAKGEGGWEKLYQGSLIGIVREIKKKQKEKINIQISLTPLLD